MALKAEAAMAVSLFISTASVVWSAVYAWAKWLERPRDPATRRTEGTGRLERLEQSVEAIAIEMERVGEAQRFLTRVLHERLPVAPRPQPPSIASSMPGQTNTPH